MHRIDYVHALYARYRCMVQGKAFSILYLGREGGFRFTLLIGRDGRMAGRYRRGMYRLRGGRGDRNGEIGREEDNRGMER